MNNKFSLFFFFRIANSDVRRPSHQILTFKGFFGPVQSVMQKTQSKHANENTEASDRADIQSSVDNFTKDMENQIYFLLIRIDSEVFDPHD